MIEETLTRLERVLSSVVAGAVPADARDRTLDELGLDSVATLSFLVAVEDEFGIELSDEAPPSVLASLRSLAQHIERAYLAA